jgi:hypothetical protein
LARIDLGEFSFTTVEGFRPSMTFFTSEAPGLNGGTVVRTFAVSRESIAVGTSVDDYKRAQVQQLASMTQNLETVKASTVTIQGKSCPMLEFNLIGPGNVPMSSLSAYLVIGNEGYTLTGTNLRGAEFERTRADFVRLFESFQLRTA